MPGGSAPSNPNVPTGFSVGSQKLPSLDDDDEKNQPWILRGGFFFEEPCMDAIVTTTIGGSFGIGIAYNLATSRNPLVPMKYFKKTHPMLPHTWLKSPVFMAMPFLFFGSYIFCFSHHMRQQAKQELKQAAINAGKEPEYRLLSPEERKKAEEEWMVVKDKEKRLGNYTLK